ncbi:hypothetical protein C8Q73DRAFT_669287 [Cubamyces lactineus]|nr:hypothetical protein C8Q73DRAFT_669287 [Cubamyces lactineus]
MPLCTLLRRLGAILYKGPKHITFYPVFATYQPRFCLRAISIQAASSISGSPVAAERLGKEQLFSYTSGKWICNHEEQLRVRYSPFNVDALEKIARAAVGAQYCLSWEKVGEGAFNKVFLLRSDNGVVVTIRIPCPIVADVEQTIASEVATMSYIRERWAVEYTLQSCKLDPLRTKACALPHVDSVASLVTVITRSIADGPFKLRDHLLGLQQNWNSIAEGPCPIDFTSDEIAAHRAEGEMREEYAENVLRLCKEMRVPPHLPQGCVFHEDYEHAKEVMEQWRASWGETAMKGPFPFYEGAHSYYLT